jgi:molybdopterin/thiamine biosynthesis adenylyltransferase
MGTLAIRQEQWSEFVSLLDHPDETAGFLLAGWADSSDEITLMGRRFDWVSEEHYEERTPKSLVIASRGFVPCFSAAAADNSIPVFVHTHPRMGASPSPRDDRVDEILASLTWRRTKSPYYASLIVGGTVEMPTFTGRVFAREVGVVALERLRVLGSRLKLLHYEGAADHGLDETVFDRQIRAFGKDGQRLLSRLRVGVVGVGGTGSAMFEQLVRLGVGEVTVIDDDIVTSTNLTRIHESGEADIDARKVDVMKQAADRIGLKTNIRPEFGRITSPEVLSKLDHVDVIFGCTDDESGRNNLAKLAITHLVPVFDMAFVVDPDEDGSIRGLVGRVTTLMPGAACLVCRGRLDTQRMLAESLGKEERVRRAKEGYVPGLDDPDPAVGAYTTMVATWAVNELLDRLFDYSTGSAKSGATELLLLLHDRSLSLNTYLPRAGHWCADEANYGRGAQAQL